MSEAIKKLIIVGNPNVGKSAVFNRLTGKYATVSNYPGTTVEVSRATLKVAGQEFEVVDTPGMYSFLPVTEEERVTRRIILEESPTVVIHVVDAKNIDRQLSLTLQLIEAGLPLILDLNISDEAEELGIKINSSRLSQELHIPVVETVSTTGRGIEVLKAMVFTNAA
ncbi:MAG: FeoB small GTPase domain-containing protein [Candidatus Omnitrophota bacterium]